MPYLGVNTAIINQYGALLLTRREDFEIWCLPGGSVGQLLPAKAREQLTYHCRDETRLVRIGAKRA